LVTVTAAVNPAFDRSQLTPTLPVDSVPTIDPLVTGVIALDAGEVTIRSAPNPLSARVGTVKAGDPVAVLGKLADRQWLEIAFPSAPGGTAWVIAGLVMVDGTAIPVVAADGSPAVTATPDAALTTAIDPKIISKIELFTQQKGIAIIYAGKTDFTAMGPGLEKMVDRYRVGDLNYDIDPITGRIVAFHKDFLAPAGARRYSAAELEQSARQLVESQIPGIQLQALSLERGEKIDNYFFRWSKTATGPGYSVCVQVGLTVAGQLFDYIDSLPADAGAP
jgi:hypothetical protein